jgi:hypothetical protein
MFACLPSLFAGNRSGTVSGIQFRPLDSAGSSPVKVVKVKLAGVKVDKVPYKPSLWASRIRILFS